MWRFHQLQYHRYFVKLLLVISSDDNGTLQKISSTLVSKITKTFIAFIISGTRIKLPPLFIVTFQNG
jgi:hypothetical protein